MTRVYSCEFTQTEYIYIKAFFLNVADTYIMGSELLIAFFLIYQLLAASLFQKH